MSYNIPSDTAYGSSWNGDLQAPTKNVVYDKIETLGAPIGQTFSCLFESNVPRYETLASGGTNTYGIQGLSASTTATTTRCAGVNIPMSSSSATIFNGSPSFACSYRMPTIGTTGSLYTGIGFVDVSGAGHTFTTYQHCGFKVTIASSVATLYATQSDGASETASSALTTIGTSDQVDVYLKMNALSSVDYYWRINGGSWSSATNLSATMPAAGTRVQFTISNNSTATGNIVEFGNFNYTR